MSLKEEECSLCKFEVEESGPWKFDSTWNELECIDKERMQLVPFAHTPDSFYKEEATSGGSSKNFP